MAVAFGSIGLSVVKDFCDIFKHTVSSFFHNVLCTSWLNLLLLGGEQPWLFSYWHIVTPGKDSQAAVLSLTTLAFRLLALTSDGKRMPKVPKATLWHQAEPNNSIGEVFLHEKGWSHRIMVPITTSPTYSGVRLIIRGTTGYG